MYAGNGDGDGGYVVSVCRIQADTRKLILYQGHKHLTFLPYLLKMSLIYSARLGELKCQLKQELLCSKKRLMSTI